MWDGSPSSLHSPTGETAIGLAERLVVRWRRVAEPRFRARAQERAHPRERAHRSSAFGGKPRNHAFTLNLITSDPLVRPCVASELRLRAEPERGRTVPCADIPEGHICRHGLKRTQRPFLGGVGLSGTDCQKQAFRRGSVGTDSLLELPDRSEPPGGSGVCEHRAKRSLLAPLADRSPSHLHPPKMNVRTIDQGRSRGMRQFALPD